ncbi:MAG: hypothetical protein PHQ67_08445 [Fermentimonas sp.]|nr:hypothetical protein [Fermentimonas sp.]MDD4476261.1 hypothetical protein [Eubacteriales bacterium]
MLFEFGECLIEINVEATRNYYKNKMPENDCTCTGCVNFRKFADECDCRIKQVFSQIGVDNIKSIYEIIPYDLNADEYERDGGNLYGGFTPVIGKIVNDENPKHNNSTIQITDYFKLFLSSRVDLKPSDFPTPTLQIEFTAHIPWLLNIFNDYLC